MKDFITTYASYITLVILGLGYFIKRVYDLKTKKIDAKHSLFQQNKISAIIQFFSVYSKVDSMWHSFPIHQVLDRKFSLDEIDKKLLPLSELKISILQLTLYLCKEEINPFESILTGFQKINKQVSDMYFDPPVEKNRIALTNEYHLVKIKVERENEKLLDLIGNKIRNDFSSK